MLIYLNRPGLLDSGLDEWPDLVHFLAMSKAAKAVDSPKVSGPPFEEALKKLETIVEAMESEDLPLETLLAKYEEGTTLARVCQEKLADAELKIQQLDKNAAGEMKLRPLAPDLSE